MTSRNGAPAAENRTWSLVGLMSHELNTPLTVISLNLHLLRGGLEGRLTACERDMLAAVEDAVNGLAFTIRRLVHVGQVENGQSPPSARRVPVRDILEEAAALVRPIAEAQGVTIEIDLAHDMDVEADATSLSATVASLVRFAACASRPPPTRILLGATRDGGAVAIEVAGLPEAPDPALDLRFAEALCARTGVRIRTGECGRRGRFLRLELAEGIGAGGRSGHAGHGPL
ncbi:MAG: sensor histidine kinase [Methanobacteriota archaeon]